jgi:hypothetical protein
MRLEDAFLNDLASGFRIDIYGVGEDLEGEKQVTRPPAQEMAVAADDFTQMGTEMAAGTEPPGATPMTLGEFATSAADVPAGLLKGAVQETIGLPGDIESLGKAVGRAVPGLAPSQATLFPVVNAIRTLKNIPGGALDRFLEGLEEETILPTSEDIKRFFDETLGIPLVPAGASERRREAAKIPEFVGELGAMGELATRATKGAARAAGQIGREIATTPPTGAVQIASQIKMSNKNIGEAFNRLVANARDDFEDVMSNWQSGVFLNDDKDKLITYPGRDQAFSRGKEGGKVTVTKKEMIEWLMSDGPFDEKVYGPNIKNDKQWVGQIERLRSIIKGEQ